MTMSMPGVSSSRCHSLGRQPAKHRPLGPACAGTTQTIVRAHARQRARKASGWSKKAGMVAASTVSWRSATAACSQPAAMMCGGCASRSSRRRIVGEGSMAVQGRAGSWIARPNWPPPAPTSSNRPTSGTARRISGASAAT
jgi:hypothetical protein